MSENWWRSAAAIERRDDVPTEIIKSGIFHLNFLIGGRLEGVNGY